MIANRQLRFPRSEVSLPHGVPELIQEATAGRALRWYVAQVTAEEVVVEAPVDSQRVAEFSAVAERRFHPGRRRR